MSDSYYNFLPPDDAVAAAKDDGRVLRNFMTWLPANVAQNAGPDPRLSEVTGLPKAANYIPLTGLAENLGAMAGWGYNVLRSGVNMGLENAGYQTRLPPQWEWTKTAGQQASQTVDEITKQLGGEPPDPTKMGDVILSGVAGGVGGMTPLGPGGLVTSLGKFGNVAKFVLPTTEHTAQNMLIAGGVGTGLGAHEGAKIQQEIKDQGLTPEQVRTYLQQKETAAQPLATTDVAQPTTDAPVQYAANQTGNTIDLTQPAQQKGGVIDLTQPQTMQPTDQSTRVGGTIDLTGGGQIAPTFMEGGGENKTTPLDIAIDVGLLIGAAAAAKGFHGMGARVTQAARDIRANRPDYVAASQDYINKGIATRGGAISEEVGKGAPSAPLPPTNTFRQITSAVKDATLDNSTKMTEFINTISKTPSDAELLNRQWQNVHNDSNHQVIATEFMNTGHDATVNFQMQQQPRRFYDAVVGLPETKQQVLNDALIARDELQQRTINMQRYGNPLPYHFKMNSVADLRAYEAAGLADPQLRDLITRYDSINHDFPDLGHAYGYITQAEARNLQAQRAQVVFETDHNGKILQTLGNRDGVPYSGNDRSFTPPWVSQMQHIEAWYREMRVNQVNRMVRDAWLQYQRDYPHVAPVMTLERIPNLPQFGITPTEMLNRTNRPITIIRDASNGAQAWHVRNPHIFEMMSGENTTRQRAAMGAFATMRRMYTQSTTGVAGALSGRAFPLLPGVRTSIDMSINKPRGSRGNPVTALVGGLGYSYPRRRIEAAAATFGRILNPISPHWMNRYFRATIGDVATDGLSAALDRFYKDFSVLHQQRSYGSGGQGSAFRAELPGYKGFGGSLHRSVFNELVPEMLMNNGPLGKWRPRMIHMRGAIERQYQALNDFGHDFWYDVNRNNPKYAGRPDVLAYETRSLTGDPGVGGGSRYIQAATSAVPYSNITMQGLARRGRAFAETPVRTTLSYVMTMGTLALASLWTAMGRDDAIDYLENVLSTTQRASNVYLFHRGKPAEQNTAISLSQEDSIAYSLMLDLFAKGMNLAGMRGMPEAAGEWGRWLDDYFHEHIANSTFTSMLHGVQRAVGMDWPALNAVLGVVADKSLTPDIAKIVSDIQTGNFGTQSFTRGVGTWHGSPNHPSGDSVFDSVEGKRYSDLASNIIGLAGTAIDHIRGFDRYYQQTGDFLGSLGKAGSDWLQQARDFNPSMNSLLWENAARSSMSPPVVEYNRQRMAAMKLAEGYGAATRTEGTTGGPRAAALPLPPPGGDPKAPTDPEMANLFYKTGAMHSRLQSTLVAQADAIKKQIDYISAQGLPPDERRKLTNDLTREYADKWRIIGGFIDDFNGAVSNQYGRVIDVGKKIDWKGKIDQFEPIRQ